MGIRSDRPDGHKGNLNTSIKAILEQPRTIELAVNDHYDFFAEPTEKKSDKKTEIKPVYNAKGALEIVSSNYDASRGFCNEILDRIYEYGVSTK